MPRLSNAIILFFLVQKCLLGQTSIYNADGSKHTISWNDLVGKIVTVDGLAWGAYDKGLGQHLVLPSGRVYIRDVDYLKHDLNGRLLRVSGFLRKSQTKKAPFAAQGFSESFDYYHVESFAVERIDQIRYDQLLPSAFDWIVIGGNTDAALRSLKRNKYQEALLALTPKEGSTPHSYQIADDEILLFYDSGGRIESITRIKLNDIRQRIDDERMPVKAYQLQPKK